MVDGFVPLWCRRRRVLRLGRLASFARRRVVQACRVTRPPIIEPPPRRAYGDSAARASTPLARRCPTGRPAFDFAVHPWPLVVAAIAEDNLPRCGHDVEVLVVACVTRRCFGWFARFGLLHQPATLLSLRLLGVCQGGKSTLTNPQQHALKRARIGMMQKDWQLRDAACLGRSRKARGRRLGLAAWSCFVTAGRVWVFGGLKIALGLEPGFVRTGGSRWY